MYLVENQLISVSDQPSVCDFFAGLLQDSLREDLYRVRYVFAVSGITNEQNSHKPRTDFECLPKDRQHGRTNLVLLSYRIGKKCFQPGDIERRFMFGYFSSV